MKEDNQNLNGMPLPLLMDRAHKETLSQVRIIMERYQMPAFLYNYILSDILQIINEAAIKEKEEAEQYWIRKQNEAAIKEKEEAEQYWIRKQTETDEKMEVDDIPDKEQCKTDA